MLNKYGSFRQSIAEKADPWVRSFLAARSSCQGEITILKDNNSMESGIKFQLVRMSEKLQMDVWLSCQRFWLYLLQEFFHGWKQVLVNRWCSFQDTAEQLVRRGRHVRVGGFFALRTAPFCLWKGSGGYEAFLREGRCKTMRGVRILNITNNIFWRLAITNVTLYWFRLWQIWIER